MVDINSKLDLLGRPEGEGSHSATLGRSVKPPDRWNDTMRRSAIRRQSVEVVELSPALVPEQKLLSGRKTRSSKTGGVVPPVVTDPSLQTARGGG